MIARISRYSRTVLESTPQSRPRAREGFEPGRDKRVPYATHRNPAFPVVESGVFA